MWPSGQGVAWEGDESDGGQSGDLLVVPRGVPHATVAHGDSGLVLVCFFPTRGSHLEPRGAGRTATPLRR